MDVTPLIRREAKIIQSYKDGVFKISNEIFQTSVVVTPDGVMPWQASMELSAEDFPDLNGIELVLIGIPKNPTHPYRELRAALKQKYNVAAEIMEIGAAARGYNALMADGRKVAVALVRT
jgi:uncharacterized protein